jgi:hypothetical protein
VVHENVVSMESVRFDGAIANYIAGRSATTTFHNMGAGGGSVKRSGPRTARASG